MNLGKKNWNEGETDWEAVDSDSMQSLTNNRRRLRR